MTKEQAKAALGEMPKLSEHNGMDDENSDELFAQNFWQWYGRSVPTIRKALELIASDEYRIVPVVPTKKMVEMAKYLNYNDIPSEIKMAENIYTAMLEAYEEKG